MSHAWYHIMASLIKKTRKDLHEHEEQRRKQMAHD